MTIARHYTMHAKEGRDAALEIALNDLAHKVRMVPGCEQIELLRELGNPQCFLFVEIWSSVDAHKTSAALIPKQAFSPVLDALDRPPHVTAFEYCNVGARSGTCHQSPNHCLGSV